MQIDYIFDFETRLRVPRSQRQVSPENLKCCLFFMSTFAGYYDDKASIGYSVIATRSPRLSIQLSKEFRALAVSTASEPTVESRGLIRKAAWCGIVFALAILIGVLNLMPPVSVHYRIKSQVVISESRLNQLQQRTKADREKSRVGDADSIRLIQVNVLDHTRHEASLTSKAEAQKVILVELLSDWSGRFSEENYLRWLEETTQARDSLTGDDAIADRARVARWELEAAKHYVARHKFLNEPVVAPEQVAEQPKEAAFDLVGFPQTDAASRTVEAIPAVHRNSLSNISEPNQAVQDQLVGQLKLAEQRAQAAELAWQQRRSQAAGLLQIASPPMITPKSNPIPWWMAISVIVLGVAAGSTAGWIQHRLQSGGAHDPSRVAEQLTLENLPVSLRLEIAGEEVDQADWVEAASRRAGQTSRKTAQRLTQISEGALAFWVLLILFRLGTDSLWFKVMLDSPLAALGRLMAGMP
jgi:hypothetical protein